MGKHNGQVTLSNSEGDKEQKERNTRNNIGVEHRNIVQQCNCLTLSASQIVYAYSGKAAQNGRYSRCDNGDSKGVLNSREQTVAYTT